MKTALPIALSQASGVPFYRQITDQVSDLIRSGRLAPGAALPSLRELSVDLAVSLITTRRAFADLEAAGLVVQRQGHGTFVAERVKTESALAVQAEAIEQVRTAVRRALDVGVSPARLQAVVDAAQTDTEPGRAAQTEESRDE